MKKSMLWLFSVIMILDIILFISCQKEEKVITKPAQTTTNNSARLNDTIIKDYKIPIETATIGTRIWRDQNQTEGNKHPNSYLLPIGGLYQLINEAKANGVELKGVRCYIAIIKDKQTLIYTPVDTAGNDILQYGGETNFDHHLETYDGSAACPPTCQAAPNVLNSSN